MSIRTTTKLAIIIFLELLFMFSPFLLINYNTVFEKPIQTTMITAIYKAYDQEISEGFISGAVKSTMVSTIGKSIAGNLLKMIPGIGTVAGGAINAGVAVAFTEAIGFGVANAFEKNTDDKTVDIIEVLTDIGSNFKKK